MRTICCLCRRVKDEHGKGWQPLQEQLGGYSHGYCPECYQRTMTELMGQCHGPAGRGRGSAGKGREPHQK